MSKVILTFVFVAALFTTIMVSRYLTLDPEVYFPQQRETYQTHTVGILCHIIGGMIAMALGPFQFLQGLRKKRLNLHRWLGRLYLGGCLIGGLGGLYMAFYAHGGLPAGLGFGALAVAWLTCGAMALYRILHGDIAAHREWMLRSYALTLAAFTLRIYLGVHGVLSATEVIALEFTTAYTAIAWLCWIPNLMAIETYLALTRKKAPTLIPAK